VGPVPIDDDMGKEVVSRLSTSVASGSSFSTDSNGREFQPRTLDYRPTWNLTVTEPVAGNYYPVNAAAFLKDGQAQLTMLVDRSEGAASLKEGALEVMIQRRLLHDDSRGKSGVTASLTEATPAGS
jgi:hypothetical protein